MAFKDDMIDAGFSDEMSYLEHLMDQGDWIVDQQIEREREMLNYQDSPYDGLSPKQIERMEKEDEDQARSDLSKRLTKFMQWKQQNEEYHEWSKSAEDKRQKSLWRLIKIFNFSLKTPAAWSDNSRWENEHGPYYYFGTWYDEQSMKDMPPLLLELLFDMWIMLYVLGYETKHIDADNEETSWTYMDIYRFRHDYGMSNMQHCDINMKEVYEKVEMKLHDYIIYSEKTFRKNSNTGFNYSYIGEQQLIDADILEEKLDRKDVYLAFKYAVHDLLCNIEEFLDYDDEEFDAEEILFCNIKVSVDDKEAAIELMHMLKMADLYELAKNWRRHGLGGSWFVLDKKEKLFYSCMYPMLKNSKYWNGKRDLNWILFSVYPLISWIRRMDKHPEELLQTIKRFMRYDREWLIPFQQHIRKLYRCYEEEVMDEYEYKFQDDCEFGMLRGSFPRKIMVELAEWNLAHPDQQF